MFTPGLSGQSHVVVWEDSQETLQVLAVLICLVYTGIIQQFLKVNVISQWYFNTVLWWCGISLEGSRFTLPVPIAGLPSQNF